MAKECQVLLTFTQRGRLASKGANAATKSEIKKMLRFKGDVDPADGKWKPVLNLDYYLKNKLPFPKGYWWSKTEYQEPKPSIVQRKLRWTWEQVSQVVREKSLKYDMADFYATLNMIYSDLYNSKFDTAHYIEMAKDWLDDSDVGDHKLLKYYFFVVCGK